MNFSIHNTYSYNTFKSPHQITEYFDFNDEDNKEVINFTYNAFNQRSARYYGGNQPDKYNRTKRKYYSGIVPIEISQDVRTGKSKVVYFIGGDAYQAPVAYEEKFIGNSSEGGRFLYLHRDYLGTIFAITKDAPNGNMPTSEQDVLVERRHFDAWGGLVLLQKEGETEAAFYNEVKFNDELYLDRGYTGHEHLASVSLIHMNGRLYDAKLRRFLAPDNFIQDPYKTQNFNRYAYVYNNPLIYNDPSGEIRKTFKKVWNFAREAWSFTGHAMLGIYGVIGYFEGTLNFNKWSNTGKFTFGATIVIVGGAVGFGFGGFALKAGLIGGTLNAAYNFDGSFNWQLVGYFAAGFIGAYAGTALNSVYWGMSIGGVANVGAAWGANDIRGKGSLYKGFQKFVGGALSSLAGMQSFYKAAEAKYKATKSAIDTKIYNFKKKANYLIKGSKPLTYGVQSLATDFAYIDRDYFVKRDYGQHILSFTTGLMNGSIQYEVGEITDRRQVYNITERLVGYSLHYYGQTVLQGYNPFTYGSRYQKIGIFSLKSVVFNY